MNSIKIAIVGIGNCASALIQGINYYSLKSANECTGLMHWDIGGYKPIDINVVVAIDIDKRKVGQNLNKAIFAKPNCAAIFSPDLPNNRVKVKMGKILDGLPKHMFEYSENNRFVPSDAPEASKIDLIKALKASSAEIMINYLPVGAQEATKFYAECAIEAGLAFINSIPVFIASDMTWSQRFKEKNLPVIGDDIKSQLGATITHRVLTDLFKKRGVKLERTYQLNTGGNTDFLNMLDKKRLKYKKISKTEAVQAANDCPLPKDNIHIGPSDYVPWQKDNKICFIRMEGKLFGDIPLELELRLSVQDSPNSAGVAIDAIRCAKLALERKIGGVLDGPSAYFCKHPPNQSSDDEAYKTTEAFIQNLSKKEYYKAFQ